MKLVAGVDIGNATTETAIARIDGKNVTFLSSGITGTTGIKGTKQNIHGVFQSLKNALDEVGFEISDLDEVRINEAAPVIGDVAMETITETIITESTMIGHNPNTPGGVGIGVGISQRIDRLDTVKDGGDVIVVIPAEVSFEAAAAVPEIARAKKAALADLQPKPIDIPEEVEWLSTPHVSRQSETLNPAESEEPEKTPAPEPQNQPERLDQPAPVTPDAEPVSLTEPRQRDEDISDMSHEETMSYLLDSIAEINSTPEPENAAQPVESPAAPAQPEEILAVSGEPAKTEAVQSETSEPPEPVEIPAIPPLTKEPDSPDIYIQASSRIRGLIEDGRLTMEQVSTAVREQLVEASEVYSGLDIENAQLPEAVKKRARQLGSAADRLPEYFTLGEDIAARVMFFMLYQMLSYTDRVVQSDMTKQKLNYFFVRFGAAGMVLSMLDANN